MTPEQIQRAGEALRQMSHFEEVIGRFTERDVIAITLSGDVHLAPGKGGTGWAGSIGYPEDLRKAMTAAAIRWAEDKYMAARKEALLCGVTLPVSKGDQPSWPNLEHCIDMGEFVVIDYTNWKGNRRERPIRPVKILFGINDKYHPERQWLLEAVDLDDNHLVVTETVASPSTKFFAMKHIHSWKPFIGKR